MWPGIKELRALEVVWNNHSSLTMLGCTEVGQNKNNGMRGEMVHSRDCREHSTQGLGGGEEEKNVDKWP